MSFYTDASLVLIPSGIKDQKVYCAKPVDGTGDLSFSRASNATRVNSSGLVERVRTNEILYSQDFSNAAWTAAVGVTLTHGQTDPNGGTTATKVDFSASGQAFEQAIGSLSTSHTYNFSIYVRCDSGTVDFQMGNLYALDFETRTATTSWQKFNITQTPSATTRYPRFVQGLSASTLYIAFAQLETGDIATDYIATTSAAVSVGPVSGLPRLDYSGGASCPSLLLEPQRTNVVRFSEQMDNSAWLKLAGASISPNQSVSPDGYTNADHITWAVSGASTQLYQVNSTSGTSQTLSLFIKYISGSGTGFRLSVGSDIQFGINLEFSNGGATLTGTAGVNVTSYKIEDYGNNWFRVSVVAAYSAASTEYNLYRYSGTGTDVYAIWGAQLESASATYATSYIPTLSSAVTRVADVASKTGISSLIGQTEGTLFFDVTLDQRATYTYFAIAPNLGSASIYIGISIEATRFVAEILNSGIQASIAFNNTSTGRFKVAFAYKANDVAFYVNGNLIGTDTSATIPACSQFALNNYDKNAAPKYNQALLFKTRLSNSSLASLTTL